MAFPASELVLNPDGSIYHLNIKPEHLAENVITVGDPDRVDKITRHFDQIDFKTQKREFNIQTGKLNNKRITVLSTGMGTDNIDIVLNELDALANIDFDKRVPKETHTRLRIIRLGTTGALRKDIPINSLLLSKGAIGFDGLAHFYDFQQKYRSSLDQFIQDLKYAPEKSKPYYVDSGSALFDHFKSAEIYSGITATNPGFYAPQGRELRGKLKDPDFIEKLSKTPIGESAVTNLEMETAGIYVLAQLLGHDALSVNTVLANRLTGEFSENPKPHTAKMIEWALGLISTLP